MKTNYLFFLFLLLNFAAFSQSKYTRFNDLVIEFSKAENFSEKEKAFKQIKQFTCPVSYYPTMALVAIEEGRRAEALLHLSDAMRFGYSASGLESRHPEAYKKFTKLSVDSLKSNIKYSGIIAFDWQSHLYLKDIFNDYEYKMRTDEDDSTGRVRVIPLRNLMYSYMRQNGFPNDCDVGFGMSNQTKRIIQVTSIFLHDFEFEELDKILLQAMENYQITVDYYTYVVDVYHFYNGGKSKFGTYQSIDHPWFDAYLIANIEAINTRRKNFGLAPKKNFDPRELPPNMRGYMR